MRKTRPVLVIFVLCLLLLGILFLSVTFFKQAQKAREGISSSFKLENISLSVIKEEKAQPQPTERLAESTSQQKEPYFAAWIAYWDVATAVETYKLHTNVLSSLSPTWYYLTSDGSLGLKNTARDQTLRDLTKQHGTELIPSISNADADTLSTILHDENLLNIHINSITDEVLTFDYDGIDIDYEHIKREDEEYFSNFIQKLAEALHQKGKKLTIAILWKNDLGRIIDAMSQSRAAQDWEEIGKHVDEFRIMAYDYTHSYEQAGPIAPKEWIRSILTFALTKVPQEKIVLGLPLYAYEWRSNAPNANAQVYEDVRAIKSDSTNVILLDEIDPTYGERKLLYTHGDAEKIIWYQDAQVTKQRIDLAKELGVHRFVFWRLGGEDQEMYEILEDYSNF